MATTDITTIQALREQLHNLRIAIEMGLVPASDNDYYDIGFHAGFMLNPMPSEESVQAAQDFLDGFMARV